MESPLQTQLLKRSTRRIITSSDEEQGLARTDKATDRPGSWDQGHIHSGSSDQKISISSSRSHRKRWKQHKEKRPADSSFPCNTPSHDGEKVESTSSSSPLVQPSHMDNSTQPAREAVRESRGDDMPSKQTTPLQQTEIPESHDKGAESHISFEGGEVIIQMVHSDSEELAWDSDVDSVSSTDTPDFKRGKHGDIEWQQIVVACQQETPEWREKYRKRGFSVQLLMDSHADRWSKVDNVCKLEFNPNWELNRWVSALRVEVVCIQCNTVILYLEQTTKISDVTPLKNKLFAMCKVIHQHNKSVCIFISNLLPQPSVSPLSKNRMQSDFNLLQAIRSINRLIKKVYYLSVFEHFVSKKKGHIIHPTHKYFQEDGELTLLGCMVF